LQLLAEKPGVSDIVDRLTKPGGDDDHEAIENHNEDEEGKESEDPPKDGDDAEEPADDKEVAADDADTDADADTEADDAESAKSKAKVEPVADSDDAEPEPEKADKAAAGDNDDPDAEEQANYTHEANRRIRQLIARRKEAEAKLAEKDAEIESLREKASYRDTLEQTLQTHKVDTKTWDEWSKLGLLMQSNPVRAAVILGTMAKELGYRDPEGPIKEFDKDLAALVEKQEMTKEAAEAVQRTRIAAAPVVERQTQMPPGQPTGDARTPSLPRLTRDAVEIGQRAIAAVDAEFRKKYPGEWDKIVGDVQTMMAEYKGSPPTLWGKIARDCAEKVVAKRMAKAPKPNRPDPTLRATGGVSRTVTRNNAGPAKSKTELADRIAAGTAGKGPIRR
jgi:hypothetical protein